MRRVGLLLVVPFCLLAFTAIARATEFEITNKKGEKLGKGTGTVYLKLAFASPKECVFNQSDGNLESTNPNTKIEFRFPHLKEENGPKYEGTKTRFYRAAIEEASSRVALELESNSTKTKLYEKPCLYLLERMEGFVLVPGALENIEMSGVAELSGKTEGCAPTKVFTGTLEFLNEGESMDPPFYIRY